MILSFLLENAYESRRPPGDNYDLSLFILGLSRVNFTIRFENSFLFIINKLRLVLHKGPARVGGMTTSFLSPALGGNIALLQQCIK